MSTARFVCLLVHRLRLYTFLLAIVPVLASAQTFTKIAPLPTGADLSGIWFTSLDTGWVAGGGHSLYKTTDHGLTWTFVPTPGAPGEPFYDVAFMNSQVGFVSGNTLYSTANGGATWQPVAGFPGASWYHIQFVNSTTGFVGANGALVRTTDGGLTWPMQSIYPDCPVIYGMDFQDANTGLVGGYQISSSQSGVFKTTDGGLTWTLKHAGSTNQAIYLTSTIAIADDGYNIIRSTDGGETWVPISTVSTGVASKARLDANTIVGVSAGGDIWRSTDGGFSWSRRWVGESDLPATWLVRFQDTQNGHVVGQGGAIYETTDGGINWTRLNRGISRDWNGIAAFSDSKLTLAGFHGYAQVSNDSGQHWNVQLLDPPTFGRDTSFSDIAVAGPNSAYIVGQWGSMFRTDDGGATWLNLSNSVNPSYYANAVTFTDLNNGWVTGWDYNSGTKVFTRRTRDGGKTWQPTSLAGGVDIQFIGQTGFILVDGGFYRTTNGGLTWRLMPIYTPTGTSFTRMSWASASVGYVAGFEGFLSKTTDGGTTWKAVVPGQDNFVYLDVVTSGASEVWACGATQGGGHAVVIRSLDGGTTWQTWSLPGQYTDPVRLALTNTYVYVTGYAGETWRADRAVSPDFVLSASPPSQTVIQGSATTYTVNVAGLGGFAGPVALTVSGHPNGATATFNPTSINPGQSSTLTITTSTATPTGAYTLTITGASGALVHTTTVALVVNALKPGFSISASPPSQSIPRGASATYQVTVTYLNGFAGTVNLSLIGTPAGVTATFTPASLSGTGTSALTVTTRLITPRGTFPLTITGTSGSLQHSTIVTLTVQN